MDILFSNEFCSQKEKLVKIISLVAIAFILSASLGLGGHFWLTKNAPKALMSFSFFGEMITYVMAASLLYAYSQGTKWRLSPVKTFLFMLAVLALFWFWIPFKHSASQILFDIILGLAAFTITATIGYRRSLLRIDVYKITVVKLPLFLITILFLDALLSLAVGIPSQGYLVHCAAVIILMVINYGIFQQLTADDCFYIDRNEKNRDLTDYTILLSWVLLGMIPSAFIFKLFFYMAYGLKICNILERTKKEPFS